ncbi:MAG: hypothetical protein IPK20_04980 [Betaproteobacteria bacterium]|nr:hypothetical protein [Betaproteobacteria bacterium]
MASSFPLFGCQKVSVTEEEGFVDLTIGVKHETLDNGRLRIDACGNLGGEVIAFRIELAPDWKERQIEGTDQFFYFGSGAFIRMGVETDRFISKLAALYGVAPIPFAARESLDFQVVGLASDPRQILESVVKMKFFLNAEAGENLYSEVFVNTDLKGGRMDWNEKDPEYRAPLIKSLSR